MILRYLSVKDRAMMCAILVLIIFQVYFDLRIPEYMSEITYGLQSGMGPEIIWEHGSGMILCALASFLLAVSASVLAARTAASFCRTLRRLQFERVESFSKQDMDAFSAASLITRSTNDVYQLQQFFARAVQIVIKSPLIAVWALWKINSSAYQWTAVTALAMVILLITISVIVWFGVPYTRRMQGFVDAVNRETRQTLEGTRGIRAYNAEGYIGDRFDDASGDLLDNALSAVHIMSPMHAVSSSMLNFLTLAIYWVGAGAIQAVGSPSEQMQLFSDMIVFTSYAGQVITAVMMATGIIRGLPRAMVSARRIGEVIGREPSVRDGDIDDVEGFRGDIEFKDVSFRYPGADRDAVSHVSFRAGAGSTIAVIGPTASGKTSLVGLVNRLYDVTDGTILVGGVDVREYRLDALNRHIGYVPQDPVVFSGTVRANVNYGEGSADRGDEDIMRALDVAQLSEFVMSLPGGLDYDTSQHGWNLSGGQRQRLAIARAVCRRPDIYIFDDSFSALDYSTDRRLRDALSRETVGATKIIVAQRVGTIMDADLILVMDGGRVVASGTHDMLMDTCPLYREIAESQTEADFDAA